MLAMARSCAVVGLEGALVEVEVDLSNGMPGFMIVGLPDAAVNEAKERVRAAIKNSACLFPFKRITVNLAPADLRKEGPVYDLPIAIGILMANEQIPMSEQYQEILFLGELSLDGSVRHTNGILPMVALAREKSLKTVFVPAVDALEATLIDGIQVFPVETLAQLIAHLRSEQLIEPYQRDPHILDNVKEQDYGQDMASIRGQEHVKRALEVAASGGHNLLMSGPPGSGKTLLARTIVGSQN
jgi:magnesium chelatase family protein